MNDEAIAEMALADFYDDESKRRERIDEGEEDSLAFLPIPGGSVQHIPIFHVPAHLASSTPRRMLLHVKDDLLPPCPVLDGLLKPA